MAQYNFGAGLMWGTQTKDADGNPVANPTPILFGVAQEISMEIGFEQKPLYGSDNQFPLAQGNGKGSINGTIKYGRIKGAIFSSLFFGQTASDGVQSVVYDTVGAAIPASPNTITVSPPNTGTFDNDLGVVFKSTGQPLKRVAASPTTGQYTINQATGEYGFAAADAAKVVYISYGYSTTTGGLKSDVVAKPMGYSPSFKAQLYMPYAGKHLVVTLHNCISNKLSIATKLDDWLIPELGFSASADDAGNVISWSTSE